MSASPPRVSVLLPVWNAAGTLPAALACVRAQTLAALEAVVVANGCSDGSTEIARRAAEQDARIGVIERDEADLVSALNAGLDRCRAPLVARFDADDLMAPERLARQVAALAAHPEWAAVTCGVDFAAVGGAEGGAGMARHVAWLNGLDTPEALRAARFVDAPVAHPAVTFRAEVVRALGGYRDGPFAEDHDLWLRLFEAGHGFGAVPERLVTWRDRPARLTRVDGRYRERQRRGLTHRFLRSGPLAGGRRCLVWGAGRYGKRHARELIAAGVAVDALVDIDPRKIGGAIAGAPVISADEVGPPDGRLILVAVGGRGARELVTARLEALGHRQERDFLAVQ